jgi:hypothetical protein
MSPPYLPIPTPELRNRGFGCSLRPGCRMTRSLALISFAPPTCTSASVRNSRQVERTGGCPPLLRLGTWSGGSQRAADRLWRPRLLGSGAQVRGATPLAAAHEAAATREQRGRKTPKTDMEHLQDWRNGDREAVYAISAEALEDIIRECRAESAALETGRQLGVNTDFLIPEPLPLP